MKGCTKTRFETEAQGNWEMAYFPSCHVPRLVYVMTAWPIDLNNTVEIQSIAYPYSYHGDP